MAYVATFIALSAVQQSAGLVRSSKQIILVMLGTF